MKVRSLKLTNFRRFERATFWFNSEFTVLIGDNSKGKTSVLDALAKVISVPFFPELRDSHQFLSISSNDIRIKTQYFGDVITNEQQYPVRLECSGEYKSEIINWFMEINEDQKRKKQLGGISPRIRADKKEARDGMDVVLPLICYYGTGRLWPDTDYTTRWKLDSELKEPDSRMTGYQRCLRPNSNHYLLYMWFKKYELAALQEGKEFGILEAIREAVRSCVPDCKRFFYEVKSEKLMLDLNDGQRMPFDNLSDGYKNMVAMVADIAHRAARLNPHLGEEAAYRTSGIVLIDEIDLHLHPKWQRTVVGDLKGVFPHVQFIATTHSPFIIQSMEFGEVIDMNSMTQPIMEHVDHAAPSPKSEYSNKSIEDIVEEVMGVPVPQRSKRYQDMMETAKKYYMLIKQAQGASIHQIEALKTELDKLSAPFSDNPAYHAFLEMERVAAGLGRNTIENGNGESTNATNK